MSERKLSELPKGYRPFGARFHGFIGDVSHLGQGTELLSQEAGRVLKLLDSGPGKRVGTVSSGSFSPLEILYHRLQITQDYQYSYLTGSGIYRNSHSSTSPVDMDEFLTALEDGDPSGAADLVYARGLYNALSGAPHIMVKKQCYVVVELHGFAAMTLKANSPAIDTVNDCSAFYFDLNHIDAAWDPPYPNQTPSGDKPCVLFYFAVENPAQTRGDDQFSLYLQVIQSGSVVLITIDPYIKNRGGSGFTGGMSKVRGTTEV